ncbi:Universal stress protein A family protein C25B2.10 [Colletotrichum chlorophyti]|uniref:Universal stress protein A family protein C25B2.10 n=1 Tax=Colletotrichum chlorophyti TaxID=708187 RepID=A0A1Q8RN09_9PEZI|nr:Universal stress protein A family protein C25B2.10 [Colletotrichum chlorophyti]
MATLTPFTVPDRFQSHVAFDNLPLGETPKHNTLSLSLNYSHRGYQSTKLSRTFMVGYDENSYSDYALQWLLDELVDDGDDIICVRVLEKDPSKAYQQDADRVMQSIIKRNGKERAVRIKLEYALGKLTTTFHRLIELHQPAMMVVGTKGRSLGGLQGLMNTNSFSKYCLQYMPVPVVVVRPTEKREKKKIKRKNDSERQTYAKMLAATGGVHEADLEMDRMYELEVYSTADQEAHEVAKALGLPAKYDPTIKPVDLNTFMTPRGRPGKTPTATPDAGSSRRASGTADDSDEEEDEDDDDDDEEEVEVFSGEQLLKSNQKERLHKMEANEAAALKQKRKTSLDSSVDTDEEDGTKVSRTSSTS